jgi:feruloyl-CoA synthase
VPHASISAPGWHNLQPALNLIVQRITGRPPLVKSRSYLPQQVYRETRPDGTILLRSACELGPVDANTGVWLHRWAGEAPQRVFIAERSGAGWRSETYAATLQKVRAIAASLLGRGMDAGTPIMVLSGNGVDHALLTLAAQYAGIPLVPLAEQYALTRAAHGQLRQIVELVRPRMVYAVDADRYAEALSLDVLRSVDIVTSHGLVPRGTGFDDLLRGDSGVDVDAAHGQVGPDTVAKILMTSGSTGVPKGVLTTQRMLCVNQRQLVDALPFLGERPPRLVDWLPWNHVFGGSHNFNLVLSNGGSLYIDDGRPVAGRFERTLENLSLVAGTLAFNVPVGFGMLLAALGRDAALRRDFFRELDMLFYAGASLPQSVWDGFEAMAMAETGSIPLMTSGWGLTETAPAAIMQHEPLGRSGVVGVPVTGTVAKLVPVGEGRFEVRVKGPNITPGYFDNPAQTRQGFDEEGFLMTGDAMRFASPDRPADGLRFDGRISEDFKLSTGSWVRSGQLRLDLLACLAPLAADVVVAGQDRDEIGVLVFPDSEALRAAGFGTAQDGGVMTDATLIGEIARRLAARSAQVSGQSSRVRRALVLSEPPSVADGEVTVKGNLNYRKIMAQRAELLDRLYDDADPALARC